MKDQITITRDQFKEAVSEEVKTVVKAGEDAKSHMAGFMATMLVTTFGAALCGRLFKEEEEEKKDGADS